MLKLKKVTFIILIVYLVVTLFSKCYATSITVTKENLNTSLQKFVTSDTNENNYKITLSDKTITVTVDGKTYILNYDLTNKPIFSLEIPIQKGMTYADFKNQTDNIILPMIGYVSVANIQGVEFEDASAYFLMSYLGSAFNGSWASEDSYVIVDDTNLSDGVTIDKDESDSKTIYTSEFGERVMEYVNALYKNKQTITDTTNDINSYNWSIERTDVTENSCKLVSSLSVNTNADFTQIKGYANQMGESFMNKDITKDNADYSVTLKVGQKCRFESIDKITGHEISGSGYDYKDVNENCVEITGTSVGKANGYIYVEETKKSFYITVESNNESQTLEPIILKIGTSNGSNKPSEETKEELKPQTGVSNVIYFVMLFSFILLVAFGIKLKKYKDIK